MQQNHPLSDPRVFASTGLDRLGAVPLRGTDPRQVGPFQIVAMLGGGGMGRIYLGRDAGGAPGLAAVKVIRPEYADDSQFRLRFEREAASLARVHGEQAAVLLGSGFDGDLLWMATDYIPGLSLSDAVKEYGPLDAAATWRLAADLGQALGAMERVGVVHRDVKPSNVILGADGSRVIDFGISQAADTSSITTTGQQVGTPAYMSPEQVRGLPVSTSSDVFALASVLAYALTGNAPFGDGTSVDVLHRVAFEPPKEEVLTRIAGIDAELAELVAACLDKDAEKRPTPASVVEAAASRQVPAPWSATLSAAIMTRVQVALSVQQLPLQAEPVGDTVLLSARAPVPAAPQPQPQPQRTFPTVPQVQPGFGPAAPSPLSQPHPVPPQPQPQQHQPQQHQQPQRRSAWLVGGAVAAVAAIATVTVLLAGTSGHRAAAAGQTASDGPTSAAGQVAGVTGSAAPSASAAPSSAGSSAPASASAGHSTTATPGAAPGTSAAPSKSSVTSAAPAPRTSPSQAAPTSAAPPPKPTPRAPAGSVCTYYSGNALTQSGDNNNRVVEVQCMLDYLHYSIGSSGVDGQFGPDTKAAVEQFQSARGLQVDGQVGPITWAALRSAN
ncbi:serine/threonine protein kinase [Streptacidiphilus sp. MAP12-16]|uniref:protein kinase domain-containing protein n=1 Tax=Streptacidiphilus sp. MAP12-16 TaxID=3156300 RepID=UPI003519621A